MKQGIAVAILILPLYGQTAESVRCADYWADVYGVPKELVRAVIEAESGWNPRAVSRAGAVGLMQLMPDTAVTFGVANRYDIEENIRGGVAFLARLDAEYGGDRRLVLAGYNAGPERLRRRRLGYDVPEVVRYVSRVAFLYRTNRWESLLWGERSEHP